MSLEQLGANANYYSQAPFTLPPLPRHQERGLTDWSQIEGPPRKPVQSDGSVVFMLQNKALSQKAQQSLDREIDELKRYYTFFSENQVTAFLANHRGIRAALREAVPHLQGAFGTDKIFNLQVSIDEDNSRTLFAVAIWQADARSAADAFERFVENWWLSRMNAATIDLAFAYKLV